MFIPHGRNYLKLGPGALGIALGLLCFQAAGSAAWAADLKFSISLDKSEYKSDEPVNATFKLENRGKEPVYVNKRFYVNSEKMPKETRDVFLVITSPSGVKLPCKYSYETGLPKSDYFELLSPGKEASSEYKRDLRAYFDLSEAGTYIVSGVYQNVYGREIGVDAFKDKVTSDPVSFKIIKTDSTTK